ncbi:MAG: hypothetical protein HYU84_04360 [Chloroflexi bacterium]|nr:hypothetical protein [Chloroflexota bacterium]
MSFLKPSFLKIVIFIALFVLSSWFWSIYIISRISDTFPVGFPFQFFLSWGPCILAWGPCLPGENCSEFNGLYLLLDSVIWYVVSAWAMSRFKKPGK